LKKFFIGILAGFICGVFSSGGGLILVPAFIHMLNVEDRRARATAVFAILPMVITSSIIYLNNDLINWKVAIYCGIGGIIGGAIGSILLKKLPIKVLKITFIVFLIYTSAKFIMGWFYMTELLSGIIAGIFTGTGMGGGTVLILLLSVFANLNQHSSQAINLIFFVFTTISAIIINIKGKFIDFKLGFQILIYGIVGAFIGSKIAINIDSQNLRKYFGFFLAIIAIYEIYSLIKEYIKEGKKK